MSRLVASSFVPNMEELPHLRYRDGNSANVAAANLFWSEEHWRSVPRDMIREMLSAMVAVLGRAPIWSEFESMSAGLGRWIYLDNYLSRCGIGYSTLLESLGYEPPESLSKSLCLKLDTLGFSYSPEFKLSGYLYRVDFEIEWMGTTVYLEVDGSSHFSADSVYLKRASAKSGTSAEDLLREKQARDAFVDSWFRERGLPLHRIDYSRFMSLRVGELELILSSAPVDLTRIRATRRKRIAGLLQQGLTYKAIAALEGVTWQTIQSYAHRSGLSHLRAPSDVSFQRKKAALVSLLDRGDLSLRRIAAGLGVSPTATRRWVRRLRVASSV